MTRSLYPTRKTHPDALAAAFRAVMTIGLNLPGTAASVKHDGSPVLKRDGAFMARLATHPSAEPHSIAVRIEPGTRPA